MAQRLAHFATLRLLSRDEAHAYLLHRCSIAGAQTDPFDRDAHEAVFEMSRGNLRAIDRLALKALELAAQAGASAVSSAEVIAARNLVWP
jgi:type II secretory pathway predicted ATPase ExeA